MSPESLHHRLKRLRLSNHLTLKEIAQMTGIPMGTYKEWEAGRQIRGEPYAKLAEVFKVSLHELLTGEKPTAHNLLAHLDQMDAHLRQVRQLAILLLNKPEEKPSALSTQTDRPLSL